MLFLVFCHDSVSLTEQVSFWYAATTPSLTDQLLFLSSRLCLPLEVEFFSKTLSSSAGTFFFCTSPSPVACCVCFCVVWVVICGTNLVRGFILGLICGSVTCFGNCDVAYAIIDERFEFAYTCLLSPVLTFMHVKPLWFVQLYNFLDKMVVRKEDWDGKVLKEINHTSKHM